MKITIHLGLIWKILPILLIAILTGTAYAYQEPPIRVGLAVEVGSATISAAGGIELREVRNGVLLATTPEGSEITLKLKGDKIAASTGHSGDAFTLHPVSGFLKIGGKEYRGSMQVIIQGGGITVVNILPIEEYLRGVVPAEISPKWEMEAIKAQAVAARTYALNRMAANGDKPFDVWSSTADQLYGGVARECETTDEAIRATRGLAITYDSEPIVAYYSSSAAGCTADPINAFGKNIPYLKPVISLDADAHRWTMDASSSQLSGVLSAIGLDVGKLKKIVINECAPSGYVKTVKFVGSDGAAIVPARDLRRHLGYGKFKSTRFAIGKDGKIPPITITSGGSDTGGDAHGNAQAKVVVESNGESVFAISANGPETAELEGAVAISASGRMQIGGECFFIGWDETAVVLPPPADIPDAASPEDFQPVDATSWVTFNGIGFGHGVGMSQHGANNYAKSGWDFSQILLHYYSGVKLEPFYD